MRVLENASVGLQQGMPDHFFTRDVVPEQLLNAGAAPIAPNGGRHDFLLDDLPRRGIGLIVLDQFTQRSGHGTDPMLFYPAAATTFLAASVSPLAVAILSP